MPVHAFIFKQRMELAQNFLKDHSMSIKEIAFELGYEKVANFSRDFKNANGSGAEGVEKGGLT